MSTFKRQLYTVVEYDVLKYPWRKNKYAVEKSEDWKNTSGLGWMNRGEPCSYGEAKRRVAILNKGRV